MQTIDFSSSYVKHSVLPDRYKYAQSGIIFEKLSPHFGVSVKSIDLCSRFDPADIMAIERALFVHGVLVFRGQILSPKRLVEFTKLFGKILPHVVGKFNKRELDGVTVLTNIRDGKGELLGADRSGMQWHSDGSFREMPPLASLLYAIKCPPVGGDTEFCSTYLAYDDLDDHKKKILSGCSAIHDYNWYWSRFQKKRGPLKSSVNNVIVPVEHPALRTHPVTGWSSTYLMECMVSRIVQLSESDSKMLIEEITNFASSPGRVYAHKWQPGDLVFWDNCSTMHRATEFDDRYQRLIYKTAVAGGRPFFIKP